MADELIRRAGASLAAVLQEAQTRASRERGFCACGEPARGDRCWWPVTGYALRKAHDLRHGDFFRAWISFTSGYWNDVQLKVTQIETINDRAIMVNVDLLRTMATGKVKTFQQARPLLLNEDVVIRATMPCNAPVCSLCGRDPGKGRRVCSAHAKSWENVT